MSGSALIPRRRWLIAVGWATLLHLLVIALLIWTPAPPETSAEPPRGVMVSLDDFDTGPPPSIEDMPIEELTANHLQAREPQAPPSSNAPKANVSANPPIQNANPAGPTIADAPTDQSAPANAVEAGPPQAEPPTPESGSPELATALPVTADQTLSDRPPSEQVTARNASPPSDTVPNGAYGNSDEATDEYVTKLRGWLARHKHYPDEARSEHVEGRVKLFIVVNGQGRVLESRIVESSGSDLLDAAVGQMLAASEPLPPIPAAARRNRLELIIPIVFSLH